MSKTTYPTPIEMLAKWASDMPNRVYLRQPVKGRVEEKTWGQVYDEVLRFAAGLKSLGLQEGDVVALLAKNTAEWFITDYAISAAGMVSAPIYYTAGADTISYVLEHSEAKAIVLGKLDDLGPAQKAIMGDIITIAHPYETVQCDHQMTDLIAQNEPLSDIHQFEDEDLYSLIYTSGSTGNPKGVMLSCKNISHGGSLAVQTLEYSASDRLFSYLPLAHITERSLIQYASLYHGCTVSFNESLETFPNDLRDAAPTVFVSVPRLWTKFQSGILAKMPAKKLDIYLKIPILSGIVKKKIKAQLGLTDARLCGSGAAPISPALLDWYAKLGIKVSEGFGMSETSGATMVQYPFRHDKIGTVGNAAAGTEIKFSDQGEILLKGNGIVQGYYKEPEKTAETFIDGWLHTGDKGEIDRDGYVKITGRVKEIFKTGKGKYVVPVPIESLMAENTDIEQVCVMGSGLPQPVAMVVLCAEAAEVAVRDTTKDKLSATLTSVNARLEAHQKLSHIIIAKDPWTIENALLTPTLKIKRTPLEKKYAEVIARPKTTVVEEE